MRIVYDIEKLKSELIGKTINWITITDVFKDEHNHTVCSYICKCGTSKTAPIKVINSGKIKSCGCYKHSKEFSDHLSNWCINNPDKVSARSQKYRKWVESNTDKVADIARKHSESMKGNIELSQKYRDRMIELNKSFNKESSKQTRIESIKAIINNNPQIAELIYKDDLDSLLSGNITASDKIRVKCPLCGEFSPHNMRDIFNISQKAFKQSRMCKKCFYEFSSSKYESDIENFISSFYNGECIKNDRSVLDGKELDLYYPEKKIAVEFNGDYWHSNVYKDRLYHYNKLETCLNKDVLLVNIFESSWESCSDSIKLYLRDLFHGVDNKLSFIDNYYINNNYPTPHMKLSDLSYSDLTYKFNSYTVYTCGCSNILDVSLSFLEKLADEYGLEHFINEKNDLEIKDKNICFHLADMLSGERDSYDRWQAYHNEGIRCVFIYPSDFKNENKINIYKNILLYHCGFAKKIYARNTVVKKYPSIKMKQFFNENNIEGYRGSKFAYVLEDKITGEPYMCYMIGPAYFGKGNYDCEITRGACKLGYQVVGGASKLWKHIINDNPNINSIVYYCDRREYDQRSISHLMDSDSMSGLGHVYMLNGSKSFMNYWVNDVYLDGKLWHHSGDYTNREPARHKHVMDAISRGDCVSVSNPGSFTNIFVRSGYTLENMKVVKHID